MSLILEKQCPDFLAVMDGEKIKLKDFNKYLKIFINSNEFTEDEILRISVENKYEELAKLIIINSNKKKLIRDNIVYIQMENSILGNESAAVVDRNNLVRYIGSDISSIEKTIMVLVSACGCNASDQW